MGHLQPGLWQTAKEEVVSAELEGSRRASQRKWFGRALREGEGLQQYRLRDQSEQRSKAAPLGPWPPPG